MRKSRRIASFLMLSTLKNEEVLQNSLVFKLADRQIDRYVYCTYYSLYILIIVTYRVAMAQETSALSVGCFRLFSLSNRLSAVS